MTEFFTRVEEQRKRLAEEKADKTIAIYYYQKGAGKEYRYIKYESGREELINLQDAWGYQDYISYVYHDIRNFSFISNRYWLHLI